MGENVTELIAKLEAKIDSINVVKERYLSNNIVSDAEKEAILNKLSFELVKVVETLVLIEDRVFGATAEVVKR